MAQALIRNLDEDLLDDYRREAKRNQRSLEAELRAALSRSRPTGQLSGDELRTLTRKLWEQVPESARGDSGPYIRAMRDAS